MIITPNTQTSELFQHVERLWLVDTLPYRGEKEVRLSKQGHVAVQLLKDKTVRMEVGVLCYATHLLLKREYVLLSSPEGVMQGTERQLLKDPDRLQAYKNEIQKLIQAGAIKKLSPMCTPKANLGTSPTISYT